MSAFRSKVDPDSAEFAQNLAANHALAADLRQRHADIDAGGSEQARERHRRRGKLLARERIARLLDAESSWLEIGWPRTRCTQTHCRRPASCAA
jgi:acetyl-CoA carboxylase carboxyltransferase component